MKMIALTALLLVAAVAPAGAAPTMEERKTAKEHYEKGTRHYNLGEFVEAADEYKLAYKAVPDTVILYNIGQLYRLAKDYDKALLFYQSFLSNTKDATVRKEVEGRIAKLAVLIKDRDEKASAPDATKKPDEGAPTDLGVVAKPPHGTKPEPKPAAPPTGNSDRIQLLVEVIKQKRQGFRDCFDGWSKGHPGIEGHFVLVLWLQPDGKLDEAEAAANGMQAPEVEKCLIDYSKTLTYPKSAAGRVTKFTYPFNFKPLVQ